MTEDQIDKYEKKWKQEKVEYILNEGGENGGWDKGVSSAVKGRTVKLLRRIRSKKAMDMRSDKTCTQTLEQIGKICDDTMIRSSMKQARVRRIDS
jgi:hypothetical protein